MVKGLSKKLVVFFEIQLHNTLALGYMDTPFDMNQVDVMLLPNRNWTKNHYLGQSLSVCGYQDVYLAPNPPDFTTYLREHTCNIFLPRADTYCTSQGLQMTSNTICATSTAATITKVAACFSDLGGAIYYYDRTSRQFILWGILSRLPFPCGQSPAGFTILLGNENDWVLSNIQG